MVLQLGAGNIPGAEAMKLPQLLFHFQLSEARNTAGSWLNFLLLHYTNTSHRRSDPAHRQLPFQSIHAGTQMAMMEPEPLQAVAGADCGNHASDSPVNYRLLFPANFYTRLLRPPRL